MILIEPLARCQFVQFRFVYLPYERCFLKHPGCKYTDTYLFHIYKIYSIVFHNKKIYNYPLQEMMSRWDHIPRKLHSNIPDGTLLMNLH